MVYIWYITFSLDSKCGNLFIFGMLRFSWGDK